jgi:hypothetical protein
VQVDQQCANPGAVGFGGDVGAAEQGPQLGRQGVRHIQRFLLGHLAAADGEQVIADRIIHRHPDVTGGE